VLLPGSERNQEDASGAESAAASAGTPQSAAPAGQPTQAATTPAPAAAPAASADAIFQQASELYAAGNYNGAWGKAVDALKVDPRHWQSWQMIGNCQYALGDKAGAMTSYQTCLQLNPDNPGLKTWLDQQNR
jgi:tetratricopeptide (TPR) repeat protein